MLGPNDLPFAVAGHRVLILEKPAKEKTEGGLHIPKTAQMRYFSGILIDAGLPARDKMYDQGYEIGDEVQFGMYAGLREAWDHIVEGPTGLPAEAYDWAFAGEDSSVCRRYKCRNTGAVRLIESLIILNIDDLIASNELAERRRSGALEIVRGKTDDGKTQHIFRRNLVGDGATDSAAAVQEQISNEGSVIANGHA